MPKFRLIGLGACAAALVAAFAAPQANASVITVTLDYQAVFAGGTDTITGTYSFTNNGTDNFSNETITITGPVDPGDYSGEIFCGGACTPDQSNPAALGSEPKPDLNEVLGSFSGTFSSSTVFTAFEIQDYASQSTFTTTSVTNLADTTAVPEPASLSILGAALAGFGAIRRRRKRVSGSRISS